MRRSLVAAVTAGALLITAGTYATLLEVTANQDAAGIGALPQCQPTNEPMRVQGDPPVYDQAAGGFVTQGITVSNINASCQNAQLGIYATAFDVNSRVLKSLGPKLISGASVHFDFASSGGVSLEEIHGWGFAVHPIGLLAPSDLAAAAASATSVNLTWTAPSAPEGYEVTDYTIEFSSDDGGTWTTFADGTSTTPSATVTGLTAGQTYRFRVSSTSGAGTGEATTSSPVELADPGEVSDLAATPASSTSVHVTWTEPAAIPGAPVTDYTVEYKPDGGDWTTFDDAISSDTSVTVTGLSVGTSYLFRITAVNAVGAGNQVATTEAAVTETTPSAPRFVSGAEDGSGRVALTWVAPLDNGGAAITDYVVQFSAEGDDDWTTFSDGTSDATAATVTGLDNGTSYFFRVLAVNHKGTGPASITQPLVTPAGDPDAPGSVTLEPGQNYIHVAWTEPAHSGGVPVVSYRASTPLGDGNTASCSTTSALTCHITGLTLNTHYVVTVTATNAAGHTSSATAATDTAPATVPGSPRSVAGTPGNGSVRVTWQAPAADGGADITRYTVTSDPGAKTCTSTGALACVVSELTNGTAYTFQVTAENEEGTGSPSNPSAPVTPASTPDAPTAVTASSPGTSGQIDLEWSAPGSDGGTAITNYLIQVSIDDGATWADVQRAASTDTNAELSGLDDNQDYRFRVLAVNAVGAGPASVPSGAVAPTVTSGAPGPVSAITTSAIDDAVILTWAAPAYLGDDVTEYKVQYKCTRVPGARQDHCDDMDPFEDWSVWYDTDSTATTAQIGELGITDGIELYDGNDYLFRVSAVIDNAEGVYVQTTTPAQPVEGCVPNAPTGLAGTVNSTTSIGLSWTRDPGDAPLGVPPVGCLGVPIDPRTHYNLEYQSSDDNVTWSGWSDATDTESMATTYAYTGLTPSTWYRFRVQEWPDNDNRSAWSPASSPVRTTDAITVPGHPTNVSGEAGDTAAVITWTAPAGTGGAAIDAYRVTAYTDGGTHQAGSPQTLTSGGTFTGLSNGTAYNFRVEAHNSAGWSALSDLSEAVTPRTAPAAPGKPTANPAAGDGTVSLSWTAPGTNGGSTLTNYLVQYSSDSGASWSTFGHAATTDPGVVVTGLIAGRSYVFQVAAVNAAGVGAWSAVSDASTPYSVPSAPTALVGTPQSGLASGATTTYIDMVWAVPVDNGGSPITGYSVQYSTDGGSTWTTQAAAGTSARVSDLPVSTVTRLRVRAVTSATRASDSGYEWATTTVTTATPPAPAPAAPNAVTNLTAQAGDGLVALSWTASTTTGAAVTGYSVRYSSNAGSTWSSPVTTAATSLAVGNLNNGTTYRFEVSPTSSSGNGAPATVDATPAAQRAPQAVRSLAATPGVLVANVTWTEPATSSAYAAVTGYVVQRSTDTRSWKTLATLSASQRSYLVQDLKAGTTYNFRVIPTSDAGEGDIANYVSVVPIAASDYQTVAGSASWSGGTVVMQSGTSLLSKSTSKDVKLTATGSMATSPVGNGYGLWVRSSFNNSQISGYCFQVDPGQGNNFVLRWWTNGKERGTPWAQTKFPAGFNPNSPHVVSVSVIGGLLTGVVDGVTVMTTTLPTKEETVNGVTFTPNDGERYGFRTWYPTVATITDITVAAYND